MPTIGITYRSSTSANNEALFYSGATQTAILLAELCDALGYAVIMVDASNQDASWWDKIPSRPCKNLYETSGLDLLIDVDGRVSSDERGRCAAHAVVFLRSFLAFREMDASVYLESPYVARDMANVHEIWCWDIMNPTIAAIQTLFPCPIRRVPFIWSPTVAAAFKRAPSYQPNGQWSIHVAEKNVENTSSSVIPLVGIRHICNTTDVKATYVVHNMEAIKDNKFLKENVLDNIRVEHLPLLITPKAPFYDWLHEHNVAVLSHSRFVPLRIGLLNALWLGFPVVHNSPVLRDLHPLLEALYYESNSLTGMARAVQRLSQWTPACADAIQSAMMQWSVAANLDAWREIVVVSAMSAAAPLALPLVIPLKSVESPLAVRAAHADTPLPPAAPLVLPLKSAAPVIIAFSDMWPGFNYDQNYFLDALRHFTGKSFRGMAYDATIPPAVVIFGPHSDNWKQIPYPKIFFSGEHWTPPTDPSIQLFLTSSRVEDDTHVRVPTWMMFIDWFSGNGLPVGCEDNPIRLPLSMAMTPHAIGFSDRPSFCGFVVSNPCCAMRNATFETIHAYRAVDSGGGLYNTIGGLLALKYPGGGCGDISKYQFFSQRKFTISFENMQQAGYITEKLLHAKMAGCVPLYWGDSDAATDFVANSFVNVSGTTDPQVVLSVMKRLEAHPDLCAQMAATPILNEEKRDLALKGMKRMCDAIMGVMERTSKVPLALPVRDLAVKTFVVNLDHRRDRWDALLAAHPPLAQAERIPAVYGKTLEMTDFIYRIFEHNTFQWKKSVIGCSMSHLTIWDKIASSEGWYMILEDDVRFAANWQTWLSSAMKEIPSDADLLYLGGVLPPNLVALPSVLSAVNSHWSAIQPNTLFSPLPQPLFHFCTYSYLLSHKGARKLMDYLLDSEKKSFVAVDHLLGQVGLVKYVATPLLASCFQDTDPAYLTASFNSPVGCAYDSDICKELDCFSDTDLAPFKQNAEKKPLVLHKLGEEMQDLFERVWLEDIFQRPIQLAPVENIQLFPHSWFMVQRPHIAAFLALFQKLEEARIPFHILHLSDEFGADDLSFYSFSMCQTVIRNYIRADLPVLPHVHVIPLGYHHKPTSAKPWDKRDLVWSFHGTDWFNRSEQLKAFTACVPYSCTLQPHWNHPTATKERPYLALLGNSQYCPILKGQHAETFRLYEALEAGCLPITTITDAAYLAWIEEHLGLSSLYSWEKGVDAIRMGENQECLRCTVGERWAKWKDLVRAVCHTALGPYLQRMLPM